MNACFASLAVQGTQSLFQNVLLYLHPLKLRLQPTAPHLLRARDLAVCAGKLASPVRLDPAAHRLEHGDQRALTRCDALAALH